MDGREKKVDGGREGGGEGGGSLFVDVAGSLKGSMTLSIIYIYFYLLSIHIFIFNVSYSPGFNR